MAVFSRVRLNPIFWLLLASYISFAFFFSSMVLNLLPLLVDKGFSMAGAVALYSMIGASRDSGLWYLFPVLFGVGMGIKTVVQATAAPEFLGFQGIWRLDAEGRYLARLQTGP